METCKQCCGNGEIVVNWEQYLHPSSREAEEKSVAECSECSGTGQVE